MCLRIVALFGRGGWGGVDAGLGSARALTRWTGVIACWGCREQLLSPRGDALFPSCSGSVPSNCEIIVDTGSSLPEFSGSTECSVCDDEGNTLAPGGNAVLTSSSSSSTDR